MAAHHNIPGPGPVELITATRNLLAFHRRCGLYYPYNNEVQWFMDNPCPEAALSTPPPPEQQECLPDLGKTDLVAESPVKGEGGTIDPDELPARIAECQACGLGKAAAGRIIAEGNRKRPVSLLIVCDPLRQNDNETAPVQGEARELLVKMLAAIDVAFEDIYITNLIKCIPSAGELPADHEVKACLSWLHREVDLLEPRLIFVLGPLSARFMLGTKKQLFTIRGRLQKWRDTPLISSYHPDMLLKHNELKKASWQDLKLVRKMLDS